MDSGFEVMGSDVEVLSLFASKLARFAKELFRLEHRCDVRASRSVRPIVWSTVGSLRP